MNSGPTISIGSTGHDVRRLQRIFVMMKALRSEQYHRHLRLNDGTGGQRFPTRRRLDGGWHRGADNVAGASGRSKYSAVGSWCLGQRCDRVTKRSEEIFNFLRLIRALWMVTLGRRPKLLSKPTNRTGVSKWTELSATRRGGLPRVPQGRLWRRCRDLLRCDLSRAESNAAK